MPGVYDEMSERSYPTYTGGTAEQRRHRDLLRSAMERQGFTVYETEWWHFDYKDWPHYAIGNVAFEKLRYHPYFHWSRITSESSRRPPMKRGPSQK